MPSRAPTPEQRAAWEAGKMSGSDVDRAKDRLCDATAVSRDAILVWAPE